MVKAIWDLSVYFLIKTQTRVKKKNKSLLKGKRNVHEQ